MLVVPAISSCFLPAGAILGPATRVFAQSGLVIKREQYRAEHFRLSGNRCCGTRDGCYPANSAECETCRFSGPTQTAAQLEINSALSNTPCHRPVHPKPKTHIQPVLYSLSHQREDVKEPTLSHNRTPPPALSRNRTPPPALSRNRIRSTLANNTNKQTSTTALASRPALPARIRQQKGRRQNPDLLPEYLEIRRKEYA